MKKIVFTLALFSLTLGDLMAQNYQFCISDSESVYSISPITSDSLLTDRTYRKFNANTQLIADSSKTLNTAPSDFVWNSKTEYAYTGNNLTYILFQDWNTSTNVWDNNFRLYSSYNTNNIKTVDSGQLWDQTASVWKVNSKIKYNYYPNDSLHAHEYYFWNATYWDLVYRDTFSYTGSGKILENVYQLYNAPNWESVFRAYYIYDGQEKLLSIRYDDWDATLNTFVTSSVDSFVYNTSGQIIRLNSFTDDGSGNLENDSKAEIYYNSGGNISHVYYYSDWDAFNAKYVTKDKYEYHCQSATSIDEYLNSRNLQVNIYPNPASTHQQLNVDVNGNCAYQIINTLGQQVAQGQFSKGLNALSVASLPSGSYFIKMKNGTSVSSRKFIVR